MFDVRSVGMWHGHTMTLSSEYSSLNTQGDDAAPTEFKNVCARNTMQRPDN